MAWSHYRTYFLATGGARSWLLAAVAITTRELLNFARSWWLKSWTSHAEHAQASYYGNGYILVSFLDCLAITARCLVWYILGMAASEILFSNMTRSIFGAPLQWLEETPHGEIINRFTSDMNIVDERLPHDLGYMISCTCQVLSILLASSCLFPRAFHRWRDHLRVLHHWSKALICNAEA